MGNEPQTCFATAAEAVSLVREALTPELLVPKWRKAAEASGNRFTGHCYAASEAIYHMLGGAYEGWVPQILSHAAWPEGLRPGETHWFIRNRRTGAVIDPTQDQFLPLKVPHGRGKGCGFLTREPSRRARVLIERALAAASPAQDTCAPGAEHMELPSPSM